MAPPKLPIALPGGYMMQHMSAQRRHQIMDNAFERVGGEDKLVHEIERNPEAYWLFMKLWAKGLPRLAGVEHSASADVESLLDRLDKADQAKTINGDFTEVTDAT